MNFDRNRCVAARWSCWYRKYIQNEEVIRKRRGKQLALCVNSIATVVGWLWYRCIGDAFGLLSDVACCFWLFCCQCLLNLYFRAHKRIFISLFIIFFSPISSFWEPCTPSINVNVLSSSKINALSSFYLLFLFNENFFHSMLLLFLFYFYCVYLYICCFVLLSLAIILFHFGASSFIYFYFFSYSFCFVSSFFLLCMCIFWNERLLIYHSLRK